MDSDFEPLHRGVAEYAQPVSQVLAQPQNLFGQRAFLGRQTGARLLQLAQDAPGLAVDVLKHRATVCFVKGLRRKGRVVVGLGQGLMHLRSAPPDEPHGGDGGFLRQRPARGGLLTGLEFLDRDVAGQDVVEVDAQGCGAKVPGRGLA